MYYLGRKIRLRLADRFIGPSEPRNLEVTIVGKHEILLLYTFVENVYIVYYIRIYILVKESGEFLHFLCLALICLHTEGKFFFFLFC